MAAIPTPAPMVFVTAMPYTITIANPTVKQYGIEALEDCEDRLTKSTDPSLTAIEFRQDTARDGRVWVRCSYDDDYRIQVTVYRKKPAP